MPVKKFRDVAEMSEPVWLPVGPALWATLAEIGKLAERTVRHRFPPGVYKHRSIEEAQALRQRWEDDNVRRYQERLTTIRAGGV